MLAHASVGKSHWKAAPEGNLQLFKCPSELLLDKESIVTPDLTAGGSALLLGFKEREGEKTKKRGRTGRSKYRKGAGRHFLKPEPRRESWCNSGLFTARLKENAHLVIEW